MFALDFLGVLFTNDVLLRGDMALIGTPPIGVKTGDSTGFQHTLQLKENRILSSPKDLRQDRTTVTDHCH